MITAKHSRNILLVYPRIPKTTYWSFSETLPFIRKKSAMPPLGLITVAAMLPENYNLKLVDMNVQELKDNDIIWSDAVFTSSMIIQKKSLEEVIARANKLGKIVVAGGPLPTQYYGQIKGNVGHFIIGEAESGILDSFIRDWDNGTAKRAYVHLPIRINAAEKIIDVKELENIVNFFGDSLETITNNNRPEMSLSPVPRFDLLDINKYASMSVQMSRGCPNNCEFCNEPTLYGHVPRLKSAEKIVKELQALYDLGYRRSVFVVDDNFIGNIRKLKEVLPEIRKFQEKNNYPFSLYTESGMNLAWDDELMAMMRDAGFDMVFVGIESPDKDVLQGMNKHINVKSNPLEAVKKIQSYGMEVTAGFIVGNDNDPDNICDKIFDFCQETGVVTAMVGLLTAVKGSALYERLKSEGRLLGDSEGDNTHNFGFNFKLLPGKDEKKIIKDYKDLLARLYDRNGKNYFARCNVLLDSLGHRPKPARDVKYTELMAGLKSITSQPFARYGINYLKFMQHTFRSHTKVFPEAVKMAIYGHHFIRITKNSLKAESIHDYILREWDAYKQRLGVAWSAKKANSTEYWENVVKEKDKFLARAKKRIERLPDDYKIKLNRTYNNIRTSLNQLAKGANYTG